MPKLKVTNDKLVGKKRDNGKKFDPQSLAIKLNSYTPGIFKGSGLKKKL
jgi:hypothetical protein